MIGRGSLAARHLLAVSVLTAGLVSAGSLAGLPVAALAAPVPVTIVTAAGRIAVQSSAPDVGALLEQSDVRLGPNDRVVPALADPVPQNGIVRVIRVAVWQRTERRAIAIKTVHRIDFDLDPRGSRVIARGHSGEREVTVRFTQADGGKVAHRVIASRVLRHSQPRIEEDGPAKYDLFARFAARGVRKSLAIAGSAMRMVATAYTANCDGCSGITAIGRPAGHGIVAVDPNVIPLGTKLYISGYGYAIAGDTGGAIRGARIDLGFDSLADALQFGRQDVIVYRVK